MNFQVRYQQTRKKKGMVESGDEERADRVPDWGAKGKELRDYQEAREGDALLTPFECDLCVFRRLRGKDPVLGRQQDRFLLDLIRRANLDAFWSRARSTVAQNLSKVKLLLEFSKTAEVDSLFMSRQPFPMKDHCGYELAVATLQYSRRPGKHTQDYTQFDTIRKLRSAYGNWVRASTQANQHHFVLHDDAGRAVKLINDKSSSLWFQRFNAGLKYRMGVIWKPNKALSTELVLKLIERSEMRRSDNETGRHLWTVFVTYLTVSYVISLRGSEGFLLDLKTLRKLRERATDEYFWLSLLGRLKGEKVEKEHNIPCTNVTSSGINVKKIVYRLMKEKEELGFVDGPAIADSKGVLLSTNEIDQMLQELLEELYLEDPSLFPPDIKSTADVVGSYHCFRSLRRASDTRAIEMRVSQADIDCVNRWGQDQRSTHGLKLKLPMRQHYTQPELLVRPFLRYTRAM